MRAPKNPPPLTPETLAASFVPGRRYMAQALKLRFAATSDELKPVLDALIASQKIVVVRDTRHQADVYMVRKVPLENVTPGRLVPTPSRLGWGFGEFRDW